MPSYAYMKQYRERRTAERYTKAVKLLGGQCKSCKSTDGPFQFHHSVPSTKSYHLSVHFWDYSWERLKLELLKCELMCGPCHKNHHAKEDGVEHGGGASGKRNCKCDLCKARKAEYMKRYHQERK